MSAIHGYAHTGAAGLEACMMHDLAAFIFQFHFLLGVAVLEKRIDVGQGVESDLVWVHLGLHFAPAGESLDLLFQLNNSLRAAAADGLVGGGKNPFYAECLVQRVQGHQRDDGGTVRVGDDAFVLFDIGSVDFRHD